MLEFSAVKRAILGSVGSSILAVSLGAGAATQIVSVAEEEVAVGPEASTVAFDVSYATDPDLEQTTGVSVRLHYDSSALKFVAPDEDSEDPCNAGGASCVNADISDLTGFQDKEDTSDEDGNPNTDRVILAAYSNASGEFPEVEFIKDGAIVNLTFPAVLYSLVFEKVDATFEGVTALKFTGSTGPGNELQLPETFGIRFKGDEVPPELTIPEDSITIEAEGPTTPDTTDQLTSFIASITASDNVQGDISDDIQASVEGQSSEVIQFPVGVTEVTLSVEDSSGNEVTGVVTITVLDTTAPVFENVDAIEIAALDETGTASAGVLSDVTATDKVDGPVTPTFTVDGETLPEKFPLGDTEVTASVEDAAGNSDSITIVVSVKDLTAPVILGASGVTLEANGEAGYTGSTDSIIEALAVSDNVDPAPVVTLGGNVPGTLPFGNSSVSLLATDTAGNSTEAVVTVSVVDTTAPIISGGELKVFTVDSEVNVSSSDPEVIAWIESVTAEDIVDGAVAVTNSALPAAFIFGESTVVSFSATDARGNTATKDVTVLIAIGPAVSVPDAITVVSLDGEAVGSSQVQVAAFLSAATATDFEGNAVEVTNNAPDSYPVGEVTEVTFSAVDAEGRTGENSSSVTVIVASGDNDTDGDGIDDLFEVENSLDPNDAEDGEGDADGDGRSNLDEYLEGKDPNEDDVEPVVTAPADIIASSEGRLTSVDLGEASAADVLDGDLTPVADNPGPFASGATTVTWTATDAAGNSGTATQEVVITPQVSAQPKGRTSEGGSFVLKVNLNGAPPAYPVEIPYTLGGTAELDSDYSVDAEKIVISEGRVGMLNLSIASDQVDEGVETIEVVLDAPAANAVLGASVMTEISIVESAVPPALKLSVNQGEKLGRRVSAVDGNVSVSLTIKDPNGTHAVDWSSTDESLVRLSDEDPLLFNFSPEALSGGFSVVAIVTDSEIEGETYSIDLRVQISDASVEADSDGDGIVDSKDLSEESNVIAFDADLSNAAVTADEGVSLVIGDAALANGTSGIAVTEETIAASGQDGGDAPANGEDEDFDYPLGVYDFQVQNLPVPGQSVRVVIPLETGVPADAEARKYTEATGWNAFVVDEGNDVATAPGGGDGACPDVGSELYISGLAEGDTCLQLTLEDGGPNDADGAVNGEIDDPSGIAAPAPVQVVDVGSEAYQDRKKVGGGCSVSEGPGDYGLILLAMLAGLGMLRRRMLRAA